MLGLTKPGLFKFKEKEGFVLLEKPGKDKLNDISLGRLALSDGKSWGAESGEKEMALVILGGKCSFKSEKASFENVGGRKDVFDGIAHSIYIPTGNKFKIKSIGGVEIAVCSAPSKRAGEPVWIKPESVVNKSVGKDNWQRNVFTIIGADFPADRLILGETYNPSGNWSSYPPHKHDEDAPPVEIKQEEVYWFKVNPPQGFGIQRIYTKDGKRDDAYVIKNNTAIAIPEGYHPVVAAPGYSVYYLWVLSGNTHKLVPHDDPNHTWVKD